MEGMVWGRLGTAPVTAMSLVLIGFWDGIGTSGGGLLRAPGDGGPVTLDSGVIRGVGKGLLITCH